MTDYRLLLPALVFWIVRIGWIEPLRVLTVLALTILFLAYMARLTPQQNGFSTTLAGIALAAIAGVTVSIVLPLAPPDLAGEHKAWNTQSDASTTEFQDSEAGSNMVVITSIHASFQVVVSAFSRETAGILLGVILGDESFIPDVLSQQVKLSGLQHLVAISGAHISLLIGIAVFFFGRRKPKLTALLAGLFLAFLVALVGLSASVLRASLMGVVALIALACGRSSAAPAALSLGIIFGAAFWPEFSKGVGFQMSVITTAAIVIFGSRISSIPTIKQRLLLQVLVIPLVAGTAVIPVSAQLQSEISVLSVLANLAVAPVIPFVTVVGLLAAVISPLAPAISLLLLIPCAIGAWWVGKVAYYASALPFLNLSPWIVAGVQLACLGMLIVWAQIQSRRDLVRVEFAPTKRTSGKYYKSVLIGCSLGLIVSLGVLPRIIRPDSAVNWEIIQCDVGQGAGLLARNNGQVVLIDTGTAKNNASSCLERNAVERIDLLVLSHLDADHAGGFEEIIRRVQVQKLWISPNKNPKYRYRQVQMAAKKEGIEVVQVQAGATFGNWVKVLSPYLVRGGESQTNLDSVVLEFQSKSMRTLVLSDVPEEIQRGIARGNLGKFECVIVAHHGARSQSKELAASVKPDISLISVGKNRYGHPHKNALQIWKAPLVKTTKQCGEIRIGNGQYDTQRKC